MSAWENERKSRMSKILDLLEANPEGLTLQTILKETRMVTEITRDRVQKYMEDLEYSGIIIRKRDGRIRLAK